MSYGETLEVDDNGDLYLSPDGAFSPVTGVDKVIQDLVLTLRTQKGSYAFDAGFGVDWIAIIHSRWNTVLMEAEIRQAVHRHFAVSRIEEYAWRRTGPRQVKIDLTVRLQDGETITVSTEAGA